MDSHFFPSPSNYIDVRDALLRTHECLLELLTSLSAHEWNLPTIHPTRTVKDLVAHVVDGTLRRLSLQRDHWQTATPQISNRQELTAFIQSLNREWMTAAQRLSPRILIDMVRIYDQELMELFDTLDLQGQALFPVAWAGEEQSQHGFDIAREYTEKWHHQQQIRDATHRSPLYEASLLGPVFETFARGFPYAYQSLHAEPETTVVVKIEGPVDCQWTLQRTENTWRLCQEHVPFPHAVVRIHADRAWRLWTKGLTPVEAEQALVVEGTRALAEPLLGFTAIMA